jgi:hypothetical protein
MNNSKIEQGFVEWLRAAGVTGAIQTSISAEIFSNDALTIIVSVPEMQHVVGPLHKATIHLITSAPAAMTAIADYRATSANLRTIVNAWRSNDLATHLQSVGVQLGGVHITESSERIEDNRWLHTLALTVGLSG